MSEAPRYKAIKLKTEAGNIITYTPHGPDFVPAEAYDQLRAELAALKAGQGEAVAPIEVIGYASPGQVEILRNVPLTGGMKVRGSPDKRYTEPVVLLSAAKSAVFQAVIRCEQKGAFKTCMECGYQDGHDQICQYHESKRTNGSHAVTRRVAEQFLVSYHAEVWSAAEAEDSRIAYDEAGRSLAKDFLARFDETAQPAPADAVSVPVELLKELIDAAEYGTGINNPELIQARALLAQSESQEVKS